MASSSFSQDIDLEESVSEIGFGVESSIVSSLRATTGGLPTPARTAFRSRFARSDDLGDGFLVIQNNPVTLQRAEVILKVQMFSKCSKMCR